MQFATILGIVCSIGAGTFFAWRKRWVPSLAMWSWLACIVFDKVFPSVLPEQLVTAFSAIFLILASIYCWQSFSSRRAN